MLPIIGALPLSDLELPAAPVSSGDAGATGPSCVCESEGPPGRMGGADEAQAMATNDTAMRSRIRVLLWTFQETASSEPGSVGIGLSLARNILELHHGALTTHSEGSHEGSQFVIKLPIAWEAVKGGRAGKDAGSR